MNDDIDETIQDDVVAQKAAGLGFEDVEELAKDLASDISEDKKRIHAWRQIAHESFAFEASDQWDEEDAAILEEQGRPLVVFNRVARTINAVSGMEIQNRQSVSFLPRELGDAGVNELLTGAADWVRDSCDAEDEESESFRDLLVCGMGWTDTAMDYDLNPDGDVTIGRLDPLEMGWDHRAKKKNLDDARRVWHARTYSKRELEAEFPNASPQPHSFWADISSDDDHLADQAWEYKNDQMDGSEKSEYTVVRIQWWEKRVTYRVLSDSGRIVDLDHEKFEKLFPYVQAKGLRYQKMNRREYFQAFMTGGQILDIMRCPCSYSFTMKCMTGIRDRNKNRWLGLVYFMMDPQRWANKWLSQMMHILNSNAKGGVLAEVGAFADPRKAEDEWASSDTVIWLEEGGLNKIKERGMGQFPAAVDRLLEHALESINEVVGVSSEFLGLTETAQAAYLEHMRKQSGIALLAPYFDGLRRYRKEQGRVLAHFITEYISDGRLARITTPEGQQYIQLLRDAMTFQYDVVIDDSPTSANQKEKVFGVMLQLIPLAVQAGIPIPPELLDYAPLPEAVSVAWKKMLQPQPPTPEQQQEAQQQKEIMLRAAMAKIEKDLQDIEESKSKVTLNYVKAESEGDGTAIKYMDAETRQGLAGVQAFKTGVDAATPGRGNL